MPPSSIPERTTRRNEEGFGLSAENRELAGWGGNSNDAGESPVRADRLHILPGFRMAFRCATGMSFSVRACHGWSDLGCSGFAYCQIVNSTAAGRAICRARHERSQPPVSRCCRGPVRVSCCAGLTAITTTVECAGRTIGLLRTTPFFGSPPNLAGFQRAVAGFRLQLLPEQECRACEAYLGGPVASAEQVALAERFLAEFARAMATHEPLVRPEPAVVLRARRFIEANGDRPIAPRDVVQHLDVAPAYLCRQFKRATGQTLRGYIAHTCLTRARDLLGRSRLPIGEIAFASGFGSIATFNREFRHSEGVSPTAYRRRLLAEGD